MIHVVGSIFFFVMSRRPPISTRTDTLFPYTTLFRSRRVRHPRMGVLVQQQAPAGADREHPSGRSRGALLCAIQWARHGGVTYTKQPPAKPGRFMRSEEHTSELQSQMSSSNAVICLKKKNKHNSTHYRNTELINI